MLDKGHQISAGQLSTNSPETKSFCCLDTETGHGFFGSTKPYWYVLQKQIISLAKYKLLAKFKGTCSDIRKVIMFKVGAGRIRPQAFYRYAAMLKTYCPFE